MGAKEILNESVILGNNVYKKIVTRGGNVILDLGDLGDAPYAMTYVYNEATGATDAAAGYIYVANNVSRVTFTLPTTAVVGSSIAVVGKGAGGWQLQCNAGQVIHWGDRVTIDGGKVRSGQYKDTIQIMCITADTDWTIIWSAGTPQIETA